MSASVLRENSTVEKNRGKAKLANTPTMMITMMISSRVKPLLLFFILIFFSFLSDTSVYFVIELSFSNFKSPLEFFDINGRFEVMFMLEEAQ